jgi:hypothetical protein
VSHASFDQVNHELVRACLASVTLDPATVSPASLIKLALFDESVIHLYPHFPNYNRVLLQYELMIAAGVGHFQRLSLNGRKHLLAKLNSGFLDCLDASEEPQRQYMVLRRCSFALFCLVINEMSASQLGDLRKLASSFGDSQMELMLENYAPMVLDGTIMDLLL